MFLHRLSRRGDAVNFQIACFDAAIDQHVGFGGELAEGKELHQCLVALGGIMLLVVCADGGIEFVHGAAILAVLEYSLTVELAGSGHGASEDDLFGLRPKGNVHSSHFLFVISGCHGGRGRGIRVLIGGSAWRQGGRDPGCQ